MGERSVGSGHRKILDVSLLVGPHAHIALERLSAEALTAREFATALKYADRRIRVSPPPAAHCFVLRAEAAWGLGLSEAALSDLARALLVDPYDVSANRRMLAWAANERRPAAATQLIGREGNPAILRAAIAELRRVGGRHWAACTVFDHYITGWVAWTNARSVEVSLATEDGTLTSILEPNPLHPLASKDVQATTFLVRRPPSTTAQIVTLRCGDDVVQVRRVAANLTSRVNLQVARDPSIRIGRNADLPTVIVPVYGDARATIECFESLDKARRPRGTGKDTFQVLAINDASPEVDLQRHLSELEAAGRIRLLVNTVNLGFVGAINRALKEIQRGDVVLLNSDTLVPPGFVGRLADVAYSAPNIGTVTPLSNNGDIFSFPTPNDVNPMPRYDEIVAIDRVASAANAGKAIDVPSGIGFCVYITRACLDSSGELSDNFDRGYLEDVDLCLRARTNGFRNVCAPSVYVGHHGSKSFQEEKRGLVLRNLSFLDQRFPDYREECRAFEIADPLRPARAALERALPWPVEPSVLVLASERTCPAVTEARMRHLHLHSERTVLLLRDDNVLHLRAADARLPQTTRLKLDTDANLADAGDILRLLSPMRVEILEPNPPSQLIELIRCLDVPIDRWLISDSIGEIASVPSDTTPLFVPSKTAKAYAQSRWPDRMIVLRDWPTCSLTLPPISGNDKSLAIVPSTPTPASLQMIQTLADRLWRREPSLPIVIAGTTCGDDRLMSRPNIFVTGAITADELGDVLRPHNPGWILTGFEQPVFGHPLVETARQATRPVAYRDWSGGALKPRKGDLAISAIVNAAALADLVVDWVTRS
ncbi:glycosyltransferase family 2 protein [Bradyrhizobium sp. CIR3A]|uniref:glycosyltransferase family 2 protein n=1 Tax=Bradyrhizobium sp. CIR3A TaxID=2663838 RepID=UPI0017F245B6|nr:glycosyltransferase family 2 protein [Bradyrhizobium sp. CIR3A]MBB4259958.1 GT2 family glycosyltransferase [Bradyrhizobium sp. CIR3A]